MNRHLNQAFTLIELLIVVAILSLLAAIALPNFLEAQTRAKLSRAKVDMRTAATAMEAYALDYMQYPITDRYVIEEQRWAQLTTPVAYITSTCVDPFGDNVDLSNCNLPSNGNPQLHCYDMLRFRDRAGDPPIEHLPILQQYMARGLARPGWYAASQGPDGTVGAPGFYDSKNTAGLVYDASNGTISVGDIFRVGP